MTDSLSRRDELRAELTAIILRCDRNAWNYAEQIIDALLESGWITPEDPPRREPTRTEIAQMLRERYQNTASLPESPDDIARDASEAVLDWFDGAAGITPEDPPDKVDRVQLLLRINESLRATPRVPEGLTADRLRIIAAKIESWNEYIAAGCDVHGDARGLREWASVLDGTAGVLPVDEETP